MKLTLSLAQMDSSDQGPGENLKKAEVFIKKAKDESSSLVIFPELFTTGLRWHLFEKEKDRSNEYVKRFAELAKKYQIFIMGSLPYKKKDGSFTNNLRVYGQDGSCKASYDKIHLISLLNEDKVLSPGTHLEVAELCFDSKNKIKAGFAICYDIRFCEMFAQYGINGCQVVFICSAFPKIRIEHLKSLVKARAIENQMYMVSVNRTGKEIIDDIGESIYGGSSMIVDPLGEIEVLAKEDEEMLITHTIDLGKVQKTRDTFHTLKDRRPSCYSF